MTVHGGANASSQNLRFAFEASLQAARGLWALADEVENARATMAAAHADATVDFLGPVRRAFDDHAHGSREAAANVAEGLRDLARRIAADWAQARGQQDRINFARWVEHQRADDNWLEKGWHFFAGETDHGPPPSDPPVPQPPSFAATRAPRYSGFGP